VEQLLAIVAITAATFFATSFDNLVLFIAFLGDRRYRWANVVLGYVASSTFVTVIAWGLSEVADQAPARYLGYLGLIPIAMGLNEGLKLVRQSGENPSVLPEALAAKGALSVSAVMLASSGDTFAALFVLFTDTADHFTIPMLVAVACAALAWCGLAAWFFSRPPLEKMLSKAARYVLPFLLIGIGVYILLDSGTDVLVG
jgi:cadmium resistance protein CadD (predicted permease)